MTTFNYIPIDLKLPFMTTASNTPKLIAVKKDASTAMKTHYKPTVVNPTVNNIQQSSVAPQPAPVQTPVTNVVNGAEFQAPPAELAPDAPIDTMVQPFDINSQIDVPDTLDTNPAIDITIPSNNQSTNSVSNQQEESFANAMPSNSLDSSTQIKQNNVQSPNQLSDENLIVEIKKLIDQSSIKDEVIKTEIELAIRKALNDAKLLEQIKYANAVTELANATVNLAKTNKQNSIQNIAPQVESLNMQRTA